MPAEKLRVIRIMYERVTAAKGIFLMAPKTGA